MTPPLRSLLIWGASGHAKVIVDIVRLSSQYEVIGFIDDLNAPTERGVICGAPILGTREQLLEIRKQGVEHILIAVGDNQTRKTLAEVSERLTYSAATAIHPRACVAEGVSIGEGTVVMANAVINSGTRIGRHVIVNTGATVDHDCFVHDFASVAPGVHIGGHVEIEPLVMIGIGASVRDHLRIGREARIGAGAAVVSSIEAGATVTGVPARTKGTK